MFRSSRNRLDLAIVLSVAIIANFGYLILSNGDFYYPDSFTYLAPARSFLHGLGFLDEKGAPETIRTPVYPLLLAIFGAHTLPMIILQHLLNVAIAAGIYIFIMRRLDNRFMAMTAALLFALDVPTMHYANKLLTETPFTALLYVVFAMALQKPRPIVLALLTGALVLLRPIAILFFVVLAVFLAIQRIPMRQIAAYVAIALVLPLAWALRNQVRTGVFTVSSIGGINMIECRAGGALAIEDEGDFRKDMADEGNALIEEADEELQQKLHIPDAQELPEDVRAKYYGRYALRVIGDHKLSFVQLTIRGLMVNLFDSDWDALWDVSQVSPAVLQLTLGAISVVVFVFATIGIIAMWRTDRPLAILIFLTVGYFIGISAGGEAESRFRVPVVPEMAIAAAAGVAAVRRGISASAAASPQ
ncbi:MAG TPA: hypothetical protein VII12_00320 [Thermoanaerobaculia bacterium]|jgi:hypothetical protein